MLLAGCYAAPAPDAQRTPATLLQRVFAHDLSTSGFQARTGHAGEVLQTLAREPARAGRLPAASKQLAKDTAARGGQVPADTAQLVRTEMARRPDPKRIPALFAVADFAKVPRDIARVSTRVANSNAPLGEIDDVRHRTDPDDDRPEADLWTRLCRRLRL